MKEGLKRMANDMGHCGDIASSALVLASERSLDINVPVVVTLMMLKKLCDVNIEAQLSEQMPGKLTTLADLAGLDINKVRKEAYDGMEKLIDDYFEHAKLKKAEFS